MLVLGFDTATADGSVAVFRDGTVIAERSWVRERSHGERLTAEIETVVREAGLSLRDLDHLAVGNGPGSFTGVRVAVNAARSLAFALAKPVHVFDTADLIAAGCTRTDLPLAVVINAHKNMIFGTTYRWASDHWEREIPLAAYDPSAFTAELKQPHLCLGDGFDEYRDLLAAEKLVRDPALKDGPQVLSMSKLLGRSQPLEWNMVQALYIRSSGAEETLWARKQSN